MPHNPLEKDIQKTILDYLQLKENQGQCYCFRAGSGGIKTEAGGWFKTGKPGCPDIVCCYRGKFIGIEVKAARRSQSEAQKLAQARILRAKGEYMLVTGVEAVIARFNVV